MSRPQYQYQAAPHVVNGGLIDFRDNFNTGVPEYAQANPAMFAAPGMQGFQGGPGMQAAGGMQSFPAGLGCVSGPPAYMHINGVMYKPVEDGLGADAASKAAPKPAEPAAAKEPKPLSEVEIERSIDDRVRQRVDEFLSTQRHARPRHAHREPEDAPEAQYRSSHARREPRGYEDENVGELDQRAIEEEVNRRIKRLNASMAQGKPRRA